MNRKQKGLPVKRRTFLFGLQRLLSYFWPAVIERCEQANDLKLVLEYGRLVVNKGSANYSYGQLQAAFAEFFEQQQLNWDSIDNALILGYGMGSVADLIETRNAGVRITGVEIEPCLLKWETAYLKGHSRHLIEEDAARFLDGHSEEYDMIVVDIFEELDVPDTFRQKAFLTNCMERLSRGGVLAYNFVVDRDEHRAQYAELQIQLSDLFKEVRASEHFLVNRIILAQ